MILKQMRLVNFKRFKNETINFGRITNIYGANYSGKSSIFDAFMWLLFGKDANDKEEFSIKRHDGNGDTNPAAVTEVTGVFDCGVTEIEFKRTYAENWVTPKGEDMPVFRGNVCKRYINGVEVGVDEFDRTVIENTAPSVTIGVGKKARSVSALKLVSNAGYFNRNLHWSERKEILYSVAPPISDERILEAHPELAEIKPALAMGLDLYAAQEKPKLKEIQKVLDGIPAKIEENERNMPASEDFEAIEKEIAERRETIAACDKSLFDISEKYEGYTAKQRDIFKLEGDVRDIDAGRERLADTLRRGRETALANIEAKLEQARSYLASSTDALAANKRRLDEMDAEMDSKRAARRVMKTETFTPPDAGDFICPTCKRPLEPGDIERQIEEMRENWNADHAKRLEKDLTEAKEILERIEAKKSVVENLESKVASEAEEVYRLEESLLAEEAKTVNIPEFDDADRNAALAKIEALKAELVEPETDKEVVSEVKKAAQDDIEALSRRLYAKEQTGAAQKRIAELKVQEKAAVSKKAEIEKILYKIGLFAKIKVAMLEESLSGMFKHTKIKLIEVREPNGKRVEEETCEAFIKGTDYYNSSTAEKAVIDLDIANALSKAFGLEAPVFFDNREGVSRLIDTDLQTVNLFVSENDKKLRVEVV